MKHPISTLAVLASFLFAASALHASPSDAVAVLQSCGTPLSDSVAPGPSDDPNPQRLLRYRDASLHFQEDAGGWNFLYATNPTDSRRTDRAQTAQLLPCFQSAMDKVRLYTAAQSGTQPSAAQTAPTFAQWLMQPVGGMRRIALLPILLLYLLPSIIALYRRLPQQRAIVIIDVLLGWTIVGWAYALLLSNQDPEDAADLDVSGTPLLYEDETSVSTDGLLHLNLLEPEPSSIAPPPLAPSPMEAAVPQDEEPLLLPREHTLRPARAAAPRVEIISEPLREPAFSQRNLEPLLSAQPAPTPSRPLEPVAPRSHERTASHSAEPVSPPPPQAVEPIARPLPFGLTSAPQTNTAAPTIHWTEQFSPARRCRIDVASQYRQVTSYEMDLTQRGFDDDGNEYLGGYSNRTFHAFPVEQIVHLRYIAA